MSTFLDELSAAALSLPEQGSARARFSAPFRWVCLANGDADFHDNVIFFGFDGAAADPVLVAKVPRLVENGWMLQTEYDHLAELWSCAGDEAAQYVPRPYALTAVQERPVLMISYAPGESLARLWRRSFWGDPGQLLPLARQAARTLRGLNRLTERPARGAQAAPAGFPRKAAAFRELFSLSDAEERSLAALEERLEARTRAASREVMLQGDFWHGNMIRGRSSLMLIDWQFARWSVDVSLDLYFFLLAGALTVSGDGSAEQRARSAFELLLEWRARVLPEYLAAYGAPDGYVLLPEKQGMLLCCVEKAVRSTLDFGYRHADDLFWRCLFAELQRWPAES